MRRSKSLIPLFFTMVLMAGCKNQDGDDWSPSVTPNHAQNVPVITGVNTGSVTEDDDPVTLTTTGALTISGGDAGENEFIAGTFSNGTLGQLVVDTVGNWTYSVDNTLTAIQELDQLSSLTDSFDVYSADGVTKVTVTITINGTDDAPVFTGRTGVVNKDDAATLTASGVLLSTDPDTNESGFIASSYIGTQGGSLTIDAAGNWSWSIDNADAAVQAIPDGNFIKDVVTVLSGDGVTTTTITITIRGLLGPPITREDLLQLLADWSNNADGSPERTAAENSLMYANVSTITDMSNLRASAIASYGANGSVLSNEFNVDISQWDVSSVTNMHRMFINMLVFDADISGWNVSNVTDMSSLFELAEVFNQDISGWDVSSVTDMTNMFRHAFLFNQPIGMWNISNVTSLRNMFGSCSSFNQPLNNWDTSNVTNMADVFHNARIFNQPLDNWDTSNAKSMYMMFRNARAFNQDIGMWNTTSVTDMSHMFEDAWAFDQDISLWNTASVTDMSYMFERANTFNQNISAWNTANVTDMSGMFYSADVFDQDISGWDVSSVTIWTDFDTNTSVTWLSSEKPIW